jgi:putative phosphoribosyl transferase
MFANREDAAFQLAAQLRERSLRRPLVLAIPRGGVVLGAILARELDADLDVLLARKLRAPDNPELALGAVTETGQVYLNRECLEPQSQDYLNRETKTQLREIARRRRLLRGNRPPLPVADRSVIIVDDGIATGSTMIAALRALKTQGPHEVIVAVPVAAPDRLEQIQPLCDDLICLHPAPDLYAVGQFYDDFSQVNDEQVVALLKPFLAAAKENGAATR